MLLSRYGCLTKSHFRSRDETGSGFHILFLELCRSGQRDWWRSGVRTTLTGLSLFDGNRIQRRTRGSKSQLGPLEHLRQKCVTVFGGLLQVSASVSLTVVVLERSLRAKPSKMLSLSDILLEHSDLLVSNGQCLLISG